MNFEWLEKGGLVMWLLLVFSIIALAVIMERMLIHQRLGTSLNRLLERLQAEREVLGEGEVPNFLIDSSSALGQLAACYFRYAGESPEVRNNALKREGNGLLAAYNRNTKVVATIAHSAPLLGLLGTVTGLVASFSRIEALGGQVRPSDLAGGIWEALLTTVFGLSIGLICYLANQFFQSRSERMANRMEELVSELDEMFRTDKPGNESSKTAPEC